MLPISGWQLMPGSQKPRPLASRQQRSPTLPQPTQAFRDSSQIRPCPLGLVALQKLPGQQAWSWSWPHGSQRRWALQPCIGAVQGTELLWQQGSPEPPQTPQTFPSQKPDWHWPSEVQEPPTGWGERQMPSTPLQLEGLGQPAVVSPARAVTQVPRALQDWQGPPSQAALQQTLFGAQNRERQSSGLAQGWPRSFWLGRQVREPASHRSPALLHSGEVGQQRWFGPPHAWQVPVATAPLQTRRSWQAAPASQQGWPEPPQGRHCRFSHLSPAPVHMVPPQQGVLTMPQGGSQRLLLQPNGQAICAGGRHCPPWQVLWPTNAPPAQWGPSPQRPPSLIAVGRHMPLGQTIWKVWQALSVPHGRGRQLCAYWHWWLLQLAFWPGIGLQSPGLQQLPAKQVPPQATRRGSAQPPPQACVRGMHWPLQGHALSLHAVPHRPSSQVECAFWAPGQGAIS
jgi:hypothetical protein